MVNTKVLNDSAGGSTAEADLNSVATLSPQTYSQSLKKHLNMQGSFERAKRVPEKRLIPAQRLKAALNQSEKLNESTKSNSRKQAAVIISSQSQETRFQSNTNMRMLTSGIGMRTSSIKKAPSH